MKYRKHGFGKAVNSAMVQAYAIEYPYNGDILSIKAWFRRPARERAMIARIFPQFKTRRKIDKYVRRNGV